MTRINPLLKSRLLEGASLLSAISIGPVFLYLGYKAGLVYVAGAYAFLFVCLATVPVLVAIGGRFKFLAWQLAAASLALSVVIDDSLKGREAIEVGIGFWAFAMILSSPVPIFVLVEKFRSRRKVPLKS